jgi:hypothetical protein
MATVTSLTANGTLYFNGSTLTANSSPVLTGAFDEKTGLTNKTAQSITPSSYLVGGILDEVSLGVTYGSWYFANNVVFTYNTLNSSATGLQLANNSTFTLEFWFYPTSDNVAASFLFCGLSNNATTNADTFYFKWTNTNVISFISQGTPALVINSSASYPLGAWYHIAVTVDSNGTARFYINGVLVGSGAFPNPPVNNSGVLMFNNDNSISGHSGGGTCFISNIRFIVGTDNTAVLYRGNIFTPQTPPLTVRAGTVALFSTPNSAAYQSDSSVNNLALTNLNGGGRSSAFNPFVPNAAANSAINVVQRVTSGGNLLVTNSFDEQNFNYRNSIYFNGANAYVVGTTPPNNIVTVSPSSSFTMEAWVYLPAYSAFTTFSLMLGNMSNPQNLMSWSFGPIGTTGQVKWYADNGAGGSTFTTTKTIPLNTWTHIAIVATNGVGIIYINGALQTNGSTTSFSIISPTTNNGNLTIGSASASNTPRYFNGYISGLRIVQSAVYTGNCFIPNSPPTISQSGGAGNVAAIPNGTSGFLTGTTNYFADLANASNTITSVNATLSNFNPYQ